MKLYHLAQNKLLGELHEIILLKLSCSVHEMKSSSSK
jgi:hypothetical protein